MSGAERIGQRLAAVDWLNSPDTETPDTETPDDSIADKLWIQASLRWQGQLESKILLDLSEEIRAEVCERVATTFDIDCPIHVDRDGGTIAIRGVQDGVDWVVALHKGKFWSKPAAQWKLPPGESRFKVQDPAEFCGEKVKKPRLGRTLADLRNAPTEVDWLLLDRLERRTNALFVGARGTLKSFLALDWALRVAVFERLPVLVISAEGRDADRRAEAWLKTHAPDVAIEDVPFRIIERRLDLTNAEQFALIREECDDMRDVYGQTVKLCVFDTWSKLSGGLDENSNTETKQLIGLIDNFCRELGAASITVTHSGHSDKGRARGASALSADLDAEHIITRDPASGTISVTRERFKGSPEMLPLIYKWRVVDLGRVDKRGQAVTSLALELLDGSAAVDAKIIKSRRLPKAGTPQRIVLDAMTASDDAHPVIDGDLFAEVEGDLGERAKRKFERAVIALLKTHWLHRHNDGLSLHANRPAKDSTDEA